jgi:hypothetical protein
MRPLAPLLALLAVSAAAQTGVGEPEAAPMPAAHAVPFGSAGNAVELELDGAGALAGAEVAVASAPAWLRFQAGTARAEAAGGPAGGAAGGAAPVARLAFDVERSAPVGTPAEVVFEVRAEGAVVARHAVRLEVGAPAALALGAPRPNPARAGAVVPYEVPVAGPVRLAAYDVLGREVAVLADGERGPGAHEARLDAGALAAGVYVVRLVGEGADGPAAAVGRLTVVR